MKRLTCGSISALLFCVTATAQTQLFAEGGENGLAAWTVDSGGTCYFGHGQSGACSGTFFVSPNTDPCSSWAAPFPSGAHVIRYGIPGQCTYQAGDPSAIPFAQMTTAAQIAIPSTGSTRLRFWSKSETENDSAYDRRIVMIFDSTTSTTLAQLVDTNWTQFEFDLSPWSGRSILIHFRFVGEDNFNNDHRGWFLDQIVVDHFPASVSLFCFGDGTATTCPCNNPSASGANAGCASSLGVGGTLRVSGSASLSAETIALEGAQMPNSSALYFQGANLVNGGSGVVFGDGVKCTGGPFVRLGTKTNVAGASRYPSAGDPPVSVKGLIAQPGSRHYQVRYRNAAAFCSSETFNYTNAATIVWGT